jgi:hypothetical protein
LTRLRPFSTDELVIIKLDGSTRSHRVSKAILCQASPYFVKALNGSFREGKERTLRLPGCDPDTFELSIAYLATAALPDYPGVADILSDLEGEAAEQMGENIETIQKKLIRLWSFADRHLLPKLQNAAMRGLLGVCQSHWILPGVVKVAYECSPSDGSALRRMILAQIIADFLSLAKSYFNAPWFKAMADIDDELLANFTWGVAACREESCDHEHGCDPSKLDEEGRRQYMVDED